MSNFWGAYHCLCLFVLHFGRRGRPVQNCCRILQETSSAKFKFEFTFMPPTRMSFSSDLTEQVLQTVSWKLLQTELPLSPCAGTPRRFYAFRTHPTGSRGLCSARWFCSSDFYHYKRQIPLCQCPFENFFRETLSLFIATSSKKLHILQILCKRQSGAPHKVRSAAKLSLFPEWQRPIFPDRTFPFPACPTKDLCTFPQGE